ncbi:MAG TPA: response regulator [Vicinamibacterales bacterium]|nr:response regulator [Vicinamibacterales bacterium]
MRGVFDSHVGRSVALTSAGGSQLNVLVVDDELLIRWSVSEVLGAAGHAVSEADNAMSAIRSITSGTSPDVVVLDYRLPDSTDLALLAKIRQLAPRAAVIFMTAFGTPEVVDGALALGAYRVLDKPFEFTQLPSLVLEAYHARAN